MTKSITFAGRDISSLVEEYVSKHEICDETYESIFGLPPVIPSSPDMDTRMLEVENFHAYRMQMLDCYKYIEDLVKNTEDAIAAGRA